LVVWQILAVQPPVFIPRKSRFGSRRADFRFRKFKEQVCPLFQ
jgi:hypothetical protein